jgi:hypothetical protein
MLILTLGRMDVTAAHAERIAGPRLHRTTSLAKIPPHLLPLVEQAVAAYVAACGDSLQAVYAAGSWTRGEMLVESDADFYATVTRLAERSVRATESERHRLLAAWCPRPIANIELKLIDLSRADHHLSILRRAVISMDGSRVYGAPLRDDVFAERSITSIASAFVTLFLDMIATLSFDESDRRVHSQRVLAKLALRSLEWVAIIEGAPATGSMSRCVNDVEQHVPHLACTARDCWRAYLAPDASDSVTSRLFASLGQALWELRVRGVRVPPLRFPEGAA